MTEFINGLLANFADFFSWEAVIETLSKPESWAIIGTLIILEGLLSADNALVLAVMVKHLPEEQRKKALLYGIIGAYVFRFIAIGVGVYLVKILWIKVVGALYLFHIAFSGFKWKWYDTAVYWILYPIKFILFGIINIIISPFTKKRLKIEERSDDVENKGYGFWRTVLMVEVMDIVFSIDSVIAAFGVSEQIWVLFLGGILGVLMMRLVAGVFVKLIDWVPALENIAYVIVALIGAKMLLNVFDVYDIPHIAFFILIVVLFTGPIVAKLIEERAAKTKT